MANRAWTDDEFILVLELYKRITFGQNHHTNPEVVKVANLIGRSPGSVSMRLSNYAHIDPLLPANGLCGGGNSCQLFWDRFDGKDELLKKAAVESRIRLSLAQNGFSETNAKQIDQFVDDLQDYNFQRIVCVNYKGRCAVTGMSNKSLLTACHIVPPTTNIELSDNADNGLYLSLFHAKAYIDGYIGIDTDYKLHISPEWNKFAQDFEYNSNFKQFENCQININNISCLPNREYLDWHMHAIYRAS